MRVLFQIRDLRAAGLASALLAASLLAAPAWALSARDLPAIPALAPAVADAASDPYAGSADPYAGHADLYADEDFGLFDEALLLPEPDPLEPVNRALFGFNETVDRFMLEPVAKAYGWVIPDPAKNAVQRLFTNLNSPSILVNDVLQLNPKRAGTTLTRFVVNSTVGVGGLFDVAGALGLEGHHTDFGQTLAFVGLGSGPYLVMPVLGPSTARDAVGGVVDMFLRPQTYLLGMGPLMVWGGSFAVVTRESYLDELAELRASSVDYYATVRNVYFQRRAEQLRSIGVEVVPERAEADASAQRSGAEAVPDHSAVAVVPGEL